MTRNDPTRRRKTAVKAGTKSHLFGAHVSIAGGVHHALEEALRLGCDVAQVFVKNQRQWKATPLKPDDVARWRELLATVGFGPVIAHATYLINLASSDPTLADKSRQAFAEELQRCDQLDIPHLVVHPGSAGEAGPEVGVRRVAESLNRIFSEHADLRCRPLLETTAGQGTALGSTFDELGAITDLLEEPERVGACVDTCHVFAAGYDIRDAERYADMMREAERAIGLDRIRCFHLNDSKGACGAGLDRHAHVGEGQIGAAGFRNLLRDKRFVGVPMILETPKGETDDGQTWDEVNLARLRELARR